MSVTDQITRLQNAINLAFAKCQTKGATVPANKIIANLPNCIDSIPDSVIPDGYIIPSGNKSITANGTFDVKNFANAVVNVPVPGGYINGAGLTLYVSNYNEGSYTPGSDTTLSNTSINVGFKPKIFFIHHYSGLTTTGTSGTDAILSASEMITDNNYNIIQKHSQVIYFYKGTLASQCYARGGQSASRYFTPTSNGVKGVGSDYYFDAGKEYSWYAWG